MIYDISGILRNFDLSFQFNGLEELDVGLINKTYIFTFDNDRKYVLQKINTDVFRKPEELMSNILYLQNILLNNLHEFNNDFEVLKFIKAVDGKFFYRDLNGDFWRIANYIPNFKIEYTYDKIDFYRVGSFLGKFLTVINKRKHNLYTTLPHFHRLDIYFHYFEKQIAIKNCRYDKSITLIKRLNHYKYLINDFKSITANKGIKKYIVHNDPRLSNFLFNKNFQIISLIDWDTIMNGYLQSDYADALRSIFSDVEFQDSNDGDFSIQFKAFQEFTLGFWNSIKNYVPLEQKKYLLNFLFFIVYEQTIRFLTDYLQGDIYYQISFPEENLYRAKTQLNILESLSSKKDEMEDFLESI